MNTSDGQRALTAIIAVVFFIIMVLVFVVMWKTLGGSLPYRHG